MKFNICVLEPSGQRYMHFLYDPIRNLQLAIQSLGHTCIIRRNHMEKGWLNILYGAHVLTEPQDAQSILASGARYVFVQSEVLKEDQVNTNGENHYRLVYQPLLKGAIRVWDWNRDHFPLLNAMGLEADLLQIGYHPAIEEIRHSPHKPIPVLFFGSLTPYRRTMLQRIAQVGVPLYVSFDDVAFYRNDLIAHARIVLSIPQDAGGHLNAARVMYAVNNRAFCAGERGGSPHWIDPCFAGVEASILPEYLRELLERDDLPSLANIQYERLSAFPTVRFIEPLLKRLEALQP